MITATEKMLRLIGMWKTNDACIFWDRAKDPAGYGVAWFDGKFIRAHQLSYLLSHGDLVPGMSVCHTCDNRDCVNPKHLYLGTAQQNSQDRIDRNRQAKGETSGVNKLNNIQVLEIFSDARPSRTIAREYNISKTNVLDIKNKKIWKHLHAA
jgi:hypothetical protein